MKKILTLLIVLFLTSNIAFADFKEHYDAAQKYLDGFQYSSAIGEFKKALKINYLDNSARIGLVNSYLARATYYANTEQNYEKAANDFRSALFYLKYYPEEKEVMNSYQAIETSIDNLEKCMQTLAQDKTADARYKRGIQLRSEGEFPAAAYEFYQSAQISDKIIQKNSYAQIADIMSVVGNDQKACEFYQKAVALDKDNVNLRLKYARVLDKLEQSDIAVQEYNFVLASGSTNPEILYAIEKIYTKKLAEMPDNAELNTNLGAILQKENKLDEALIYYKKAEQINPSNITTRLNLGTLYQQKKDFASALSAYNSVLVIYPNNIDANVYKAEALADMGDTQAALQAFKRVLAIDPTNANAKKQMILILKDTMTPQEMLAYLSSDAAIDKESIMALYDYARDLHKQNKTDDAIICYKEVLKNKSDFSELYVNLALAYTQKKDYASAEKILQDAKIKFPTDSQIVKMMSTVNEESKALKYTDASTFFTNGEYQKALDIYLAIQPPTSDVLVGIAACYKGLDNVNKAIEYYKKALVIDSTNSDVAYYIGVLYAEIENWSAAKIYLQKALSINPKNVHAEDLLASVVEQNNVLLINKVIELYNKSSYEESLKIISQVLTEDSKNAYAYYYRGLIYDAKNKPLQAIEEYKKSIANNPELVIADYLIATAYDSLGQYKNALSYYKTFLQSATTDDQYKKYAKIRVNDLKNYDK